MKVGVDSLKLKPEKKEGPILIRSPFYRFPRLNGRLGDQDPCRA
jgi:hypothetical protein